MEKGDAEDRGMRPVVFINHILYIQTMFERSIIELCRQLRKNQTPSELLLWQKLRSRNFSGFKFRRQHPVIYQSIQGRRSFFIPDFYCSEAKLVIEVDGKIHDFQKDYDENRDRILEELGLRTIRIKNEDLKRDLETVALKIVKALQDC